MESALKHTKRILSSYTLKAKKSMGQNFLTDDTIVETIISGSGLIEGEEVIEVGPGTGVLTRALAGVASHVWAVELDNVLSEVLQEEFKNRSNIDIIHADALNFQIKDLPDSKEKNYRLVANIPYYITSPLIKHFINQRNYLKTMTIMIQEEVAHRITASPGSKNYGVLSLAVQAFCTAKILCGVPANSFLPPPRVKSAVVHMEILDHPHITDDMEEVFFKVVKAAFGQRRKTLLNSLSTGLKLSKESVSPVLERVGISPMARAETLSINDYIHLMDQLSSLQNFN